MEIISTELTTLENEENKKHISRNAQYRETKQCKKTIYKSLSLKILKINENGYQVPTVTSSVVGR